MRSLVFLNLQAPLGFLHSIVGTETKWLPELTFNHAVRIFFMVTGAAKAFFFKKAQPINSLMANQIPCQAKAAPGPATFKKCLEGHQERWVAWCPEAPLWDPCPRTIKQSGTLPINSNEMHISFCKPISIKLFTGYSPVYSLFT